MNKPLTGWITPEVTAAQAQAAAPQLEPRLRHALPLGAHLVVGVCEGVVTHVSVGVDVDVAWN